MKAKSRNISFGMINRQLVFITSVLVLLLLGGHSTNVDAKIAAGNANAKVLRFAVIGVSGSQREALLQISYKFEQAHRDSYIRYVFQEDAALKRNLPDLLNQNGQVDVVMWHAGERLFSLTSNDSIEPLTDLWQANDYDEVLGQQLKTLVTKDGEVWGIPISYYPWGFYYKKPLFRKFGLTPPRTWAGLQFVLKKLSQEGINPISVASLEGWPVSAWFEYINLRLNGLEFHQQFAKAEVSYQDEKILNVLQHWAATLPYINESHDVLDWRNSLPDLFREKSGVALLGNFMTQLIPPVMKDKIGFFAFPGMQNEYPRYELAPTDVLVLAKNSNNPELAKQFISFFARPEQQVIFNSKINQLPTHGNATVRGDLNQAGVELLSNSDGLAQYYDRDAPKVLADKIIPLWVEFLKHGDVKNTAQKMELARQQFLASVE